MSALLEISDVRKLYRKSNAVVRALDGVSLAVDLGEFVVVRGPSGCGKTTLLLTAGGLLAPDGGRVAVNGRDPYALSPEARARLRAELVGFQVDRAKCHDGDTRGTGHCDLVGRAIEIEVQPLRVSLVGEEPDHAAA